MYEELVKKLRSGSEDCDVMGEAACVIEMLEGELKSAKIDANNFRKALEALDAVKR